jgi:hypothetical protein
MRWVKSDDARVEEVLAWDVEKTGKVDGEAGKETVKRDGKGWMVGEWVHGH